MPEITVHGRSGLPDLTQLAFYTFMQPVIKQTHKAEKVKGRPGGTQHLQKRLPFKRRSQMEERSNKSRNVGGLNRKIRHNARDNLCQGRSYGKFRNTETFRDVRSAQLFHQARFKFSQMYIMTQNVEFRT